MSTEIDGESIAVSLPAATQERLGWDATTSTDRCTLPFCEGGRTAGVNPRTVMEVEPDA